MGGKTKLKFAVLCVLETINRQIPDIRGAEKKEQKTGYSEARQG